MERNPPSEEFIRSERELNRWGIRILSMDYDWNGIHGWQWARVKELIPQKKKPYLRRRRTGGRPRSDDWKCFDAIVWTARTGLPWRSLDDACGREPAFWRLELKVILDIEFPKKRYT